MGEVFLAEDRRLGRKVALKLLPEGLLADKEMRRRFAQEARTASALNHPNIVTIYDAGEHQGTFFIAMEYLEGTTLQQMIATRRALPPEEVVRIGTQICEGLEYAHARGVIHRDIKPANIIVTTGGTVKITDFGIAKAEQTLAAQLTITGQIVGTPDYMSPEQVKGTTIDGRSDLFSLGVVLYQMTTGEKPFPGESVTTVIYKIVHETPIAPHALDSSVPAGLSAVITQALAKTPDQRFQTARAMREALRNYRQTLYTGQTVSLEMPQPGQQQGASTLLHQRPSRRETSWKKRTSLWAGAGLLVVVAAAAMLLSTSHNRQQQPDISISSPGPSSANSSSSGSSQPGNSSPASSTPSREAAPVPAPPTPAVPPIADMTNQAIKLGDYMTKSAAEQATKAIQSAMPMKGGLSVTSTPSGATVSVDGKSEGWKTPVHIPSVSMGAHTVLLTKPGYQPLSVTAPVTPGSGGAVNARLMPEGSTKPSSAEVSGAARSGGSSADVSGAARSGGPHETSATGTVVITSTPPGARIVLEQYGENKTTPARLTVPAGNHELVVMKDGYLPVTRNIEVKAGRVTEVNAKLPPIPGRP